MIDLVSASPYVAYLGPLMVVGLLITSWGRFKVNKGDAAKKIVDSAAGAVDILRDECAELRKDLAAARKEAKSLSADLAEAQAEVTDLRGQVDRMSKDLSATQTELAAARGERGSP